MWHLLIPAAASLFGSMIQANSAREANRMNLEYAETKHQREVEDLKAAGLNPILSAGGTGSMPAPAVPIVQDNPGSQMVQSVLAAERLFGVDKPLAAAEITLKGNQAIRALEEVKELQTRAKLNSAYEEEAKARQQLVLKQIDHEVVKVALTLALSAKTEAEANKLAEELYQEQEYGRQSKDLDVKIKGQEWTKLYTLGFLSRKPLLEGGPNYFWAGWSEDQWRQMQLTTSILASDDKIREAAAVLYNESDLFPIVEKLLDVFLPLFK